MGTLNEFIEELASASPVPGGGGASALIGAVGAALCAMAANLTSGKKKYEIYQQDINAIILRASASVSDLLELIEKDAECFEPLSRAYGIPKDDPRRDEILENALVAACGVPMEILKKTADIADLAEQLAEKSSRLVLSDVGVAASACRCSMESAAMNIYINTKLMKNKDYAKQTNAEAEALLKNGVLKCDAIYRRIADELKI